MQLVVFYRLRPSSRLECMIPVLISVASISRVHPACSSTHLACPSSVSRFPRTLSVANYERGLAENHHELKRRSACDGGSYLTQVRTSYSVVMMRRPFCFSVSVFFLLRVTYTFLMRSPGYIYHFPYPPCRPLLYILPLLTVFNIHMARLLDHSCDFICRRQYWRQYWRQYFYYANPM
jgi:hypothetical protein